MPAAAGTNQWEQIPRILPSHHLSLNNDYFQHWPEPRTGHVAFGEPLAVALRLCSFLCLTHCCTAAPSSLSLCLTHCLLHMHFSIQM